MSHPVQQEARMTSVCLAACSMLRTLVLPDFIGMWMTWRLVAHYSQVNTISGAVLLV